MTVGEGAPAEGYIARLRRRVGQDKLLTVGVRAIIRDNAGAILLQRRGDFGTWGLPAGAMELDESVFAALGREVREETGIRVVRATPFGIYSDPRYSVTYPNGDQVQAVGIAFQVLEWVGNLAADGEESLALAFFAPDRLPPAEQMFPPHHKTILDFLAFLEDGAFVVD